MAVESQEHVVQAVIAQPGDAVSVETATRQSPRGITRALQVAAALVLALEALDEFRNSRRRVRVAASSWWAGVERRERHRLHAAELGYLAAKFPSQGGKRGAGQSASRSGKGRAVTRSG